MTSLFNSLSRRRPLAENNSSALQNLLQAKDEKEKRKAARMKGEGVENMHFQIPKVQERKDAGSDSDDSPNDSYESCGDEDDAIRIPSARPVKNTREGMKAGGWHSKPSIDNGLANMLGNLNLGPQSLEAGRSAPEESELSTAFQSAACTSASDLIYYSDGEEEVRSPLPKQRQSLADEFHSPDSERETHAGPEPDRSNSRMSGSIRGSSPPSQPNKSTFQLNKTSLAAVSFQSAQSRTNAFDPAVGPSPVPPVKAGRQRLVKVSELPKPILKPESQPPSVRPAAVRKHAIRQERSFVDLSDSEDEGEGDGREFEAPLREDAGCLKLGDGKCILRGALAKGLYPHQRQGLEWLWSLHEKEGGGGILGDDMGLGKTRQVASFLAALFTSSLIRTVLLVVSSTLLAQWRLELASVGLRRKTREYSCNVSAGERWEALESSLEVGGVLLTTYDMVALHLEEFQGGETDTWDWVVMDEGHLAKNPKTKRFKALRDLPRHHCLILTGTPVQNKLNELWALFHLSYPPLLGEQREFKHEFESVITDGRGSKATRGQRMCGDRAAEALRKKIAPYFLRRLKAEIFQSSTPAHKSGAATSAPVRAGAPPSLPKKNDIIVWLPLADRQRHLYTAYLESSEVQAALNPDIKGRVLCAITMLKRICDHPSLLNQRAIEIIDESRQQLSSRDSQEAEKVAGAINGMGGESLMHDLAASCKMSFLLPLLEELTREGHRTLVFSQTRMMLDMVQDEVEKRGWEYCRVDGSMPVPTRERRVAEFQTNTGIPIFLLTTQVGGLGLTLHGADRVVIMNPSWNPSVDNQSVDRAYRIGQRRHVVVYRLMTAGTVEEVIYQRQVFKGSLMKIATEEKDQLRYFDDMDRESLFTVPEGGFDVSEVQLHLQKEHGDQINLPPHLQAHIEFLESQNIVGVSHHDLLFSKDAPEREEEEGEEGEDPRNYAQPIKGLMAQARANMGVNDMQSYEARQARERVRTAVSASEALKNQIVRAHQLLNNPNLKLGDGGAKIRTRIAHLDNELIKSRATEALAKAAARLSIGPSPAESSTNSNFLHPHMRPAPGIGPQMTPAQLAPRQVYQPSQGVGPRPGFEARAGFGAGVGAGAVVGMRVGGGMRMGVENIGTEVGGGVRGDLGGQYVGPPVPSAPLPAGRTSSTER